jgi:hypothetical protein
MVSLNTPPPLPNLLSSVSNQGQSGPRNPILKRVRYFAMGALSGRGCSLCDAGIAKQQRTAVN